MLIRLLRVIISRFLSAVRRGRGSGSGWIPAALAVAGGLLCAAVGLAVVSAWLTGTTALLHFGSRTPMYFNTGLAFTVTGFALAAVAVGWPRAALVAGVFDVVLTTIVLAEYAAGRDLGIDQLVVRAYGSGPGDTPGRLALNTAVCFLVAGLTLLAAGSSRRRLPALLAVAGSLIATIALAAVFGYVTAAPVAYGWGHLTGMAALTAVTMCLLGLTLLAAAWAAALPLRRGLPWWLPIPAGVLALGLVAGLWLVIVGIGSHAGHITVDTAITAATILGFLTGVLVGVAVWLAQQSDARRRTAVAEAAQRRTLQLYTRSLIESSIDALITTDPHGVITDVNQQAETLTGFGRGELIGTGFGRYFIDQARADDVIAAAIRDAKVTDYVLTARHRSGQETPVACNAATFYGRGGDLRGVVTAARDITERLIIEKRQRRLSEELETRVAERTSELEYANRELEAFASTVSHDLRAPLRAMDGFSSLLLEDYSRQVDERGRHYLARIRAGALMMGTMIDELLQLSRVSRTVLHREPVDITAMARQIAAELRLTAPRRHADFIIAGGLTAQADPSLLEVMLRQLLSNAWKFTSAREHARIEVGAVSRDGTAEFYVRDNGAGFDMAYSNQLFQPFLRLHRPAEFPGAGIGLASVQRVIARHGGRIWAYGEPGRGATFTFTLAPAQPEAAGAA